MTARIAELERVLERERAAHEVAHADLLERERAALERAIALRQELHDERRRKEKVVVAEAVPGARVGVFVDASNLSASARRELGGKFNFIALLRDVVGERVKSLAVAFLVNGDADGTEKTFQGFAALMRQSGYETREKRPRARADGSRKADWDMGIAMEILDALGGLDVVVLCSGDGDFLPLLHRVRREGKRVELAAFRASADDALVRGADVFHALDERYRMSS